MIKNLIFDFGKVLVDYDFKALLDTYFSDEDECLRFNAIFTCSEFIDKCDREIIPFADIINEAKHEHPEFEDALQFFYDHYADFVTGEIPGMKAQLIRFKKEGFKLYGLTNWSSAVYTVMRRYSDLFELLDGIVISSEEHLIKPEPDIYLRLCERYGLKPEECLFADDKPINVSGAKAIGMEAVVFSTTEQYLNDFNQIYQTVK